MPHSLARLHIHLVFSTKNRERVLDDAIRDSLHRYIADVLQNLGRENRFVALDEGLSRPFRASPVASPTSQGVALG